MNVIPHPTIIFDEKLAKLRGPTWAFGDNLLKLFQEAVETGASRGPILRFLLSNEGKARLKAGRQYFGNVHEALIPWSRANYFELESKLEVEGKGLEEVEKPSGTESADESSSDSVDSELLDSFRQLGWAAAEESQKLAAIANTHRYGGFYPGWEIDNTEWSNFFGDDDPCLTITFYIRNLFAHPSSPSTNFPTKSRSFSLGDTDRRILDLILSRCAQFLYEDPDCFQGIGVRTLRKILNASCGAWLWGDSIDCFAPSFLGYISRASDSVGRGLIEFWQRQDPPGRNENEQDKREILEDQIDFFSGCLLKALTSRGVSENKKFPRTNFFSDEEYEKLPTFAMTSRELLSLKEALFYLHIDIYTFSYDGMAAEAIYNARDPLFGGCFPFLLDESYPQIGVLSRDPSFWLACFSSYGNDGTRFGDDDPFMVFNRPYVRDQSIKDESRATRRFDSFRQTYDDMVAAGFRELSIAWWAFFVASQAMAFPNMGLSPTQIGILSRINESLLPNRMIEKSVRLALKLSDRSSQPLHSRILEDAMSSLLVRAQGDSGNVIEFRSTRDEKAAFIKHRLGKTLWESLSAPSRQDVRRQIN